MVYARKVPVKTDHAKCFGDFTDYIWNTFTRLSDNSKRIDIFFDLCIYSSTKGNERVRRKQSVQPLLQPFTTKTKNFLLQWKVLGLTLQTKNNYSCFL